VKAILLLLVALTGPAAAQPLDPCMKAYNDEIVGIEREAKAKQNTGSEAAKQRAARAGQARVEAAAQRAKKCQAEARADPAAVKPAATEAECKARASERLGDIERRHSGGGPAAQAGRGQEELNVRAELMECSRRARDDAGEAKGPVR
jgi:hypothetical protein